jgi:hypothetical protein
VRRILSVLLLCLAVPAVANAALAGDGERYAAWDANRVVHVLDEAGPPQTVAVPAGCRFASVGAGRLLFDCTARTLSGLTVRGRTRDLATGVLADLPDLDQRSISSAYDAAYSAIGRRWGAIALSGYHWHGTAYLPLDGGPARRHTFPDFGAIPSTRRVVDLDVPDLDVDVCRPLRIPGADDDHQLPVAVYRRPYLFVRSGGGDLWRHRCGTGATTRVARGVSKVVAGNAALAWVDTQGRAHLQTPRGTSRLWPSIHTVVALVLTGERAVALTADGRVLIHRLTTGSGG